MKVGTAIGRPWLARALVRAGHAVATSGGSDFHGFGDTRAALGLVVLPPREIEALEARVPGRAAGRPS